MNMTTIGVSIAQYIGTKFKTLTQFGRWLKLNFSKREILLNKILGLDSKSGKLVIVKDINKKPAYCIIDLKQVQSCSLKKEYGSISAGSLHRNRLEDFLDSISLKLHLKRSNHSIELKFYETKSNSLDQLPLLEEKAKEWELAVSSLISKAAA